MALRTKNIITKASDIDTHWAFEFYLGLPFRLTGGDHKVKSPFSVDKDPSFCVYKRKTEPNGPYRFNDLSTGFKGSIMDLVAKLKSPNHMEPMDQATTLAVIRKDFNLYLENNTYTSGIERQLPHSKGEVTEWALRKWVDDDFKWWAAYGVSRATLEKFNVAPMHHWKMHKVVEGKEKLMDFNNPMAYGFLTKKGELIKIYQPGKAGAKYLKVTNYLQGIDQLEFKANELLILSSLKDLMAFHDLDIPGYELIAPDSENVVIPKAEIDLFKSKYKRIRTLFDNDPAGRKAIIPYKELYGIDDDIFLDMSKDLSDSIKDVGQAHTKLNLLYLL